MRRLYLFATSALLAAVAVVAFHYWRHRFITNDADLLRYLVPNRGTTVFVDVRQLRPLLPKAPHRDPDFETFVRQTGFDYERDVDAAAAQFWGDNRAVVLLRGHFNWSAIQHFAAVHGGSCSGDGACSMPARGSGHTFAFRALQPDVLLATVGSLEVPVRRPDPPVLPSAPAFVQVPAELLRQSDQWPVPLSQLASTVAPAAPIILSAAAAVASSSAAFILNLDCIAATETVAGNIRKQLELEAKLVQLQLARAHRQPDPASLLGLLTAGDCRTDGRQLHCSWPVSRQFLASLQ